MRTINYSNLVFLRASSLMLAIIVALSLVMPLTANAQATPVAATQSSMSSQSASTMAMRKSMESMHEKMMAMQMSGNVDYDFVTMMRIHHEAALHMAQVELDNGKDPTMLRVAKNIIAAQKKEIAEFDRWLSTHKQ